MVAALVVLAIAGLATTGWARDANKIKDPNKVAKKRDRNAQPPAPAPFDLKATIIKAEGKEITVLVTLPVDAATTSVLINGVGKAIADLKPGEAVSITLDGGKTTRIEATEITKEPAKEPAKEPVKEPAKAL
jgi:hypothetical protein